MRWLVPPAFGLTAALTAAPAFAQTAEPSSTAATYGNWTVSCVQSADQKVCQMTTKLNLKGSDGQVRPLLEVAIGQPPAGGDVRIVLQVPMDVALREPVVVSVDAAGAAGAGAAEATPKPQTDLLTASFFACQPAGCIADAVLDAKTLKTLQTATTMNATFTALAGARKITVPVALTGFTDAWAALGSPAP